MSKLAALKGKTGPSSVTKIDNNLTANHLADALDGPKDEPRKARKKTHRTVPFSTRVSQQFDDEFRRIAFERKMKHAELMEAMLELCKKHNL